jgi:hypothetical protein
LGGAFAGAAGSGFLESLNIGIGVKKGSLSGFRDALLLGAAGGAFGNALAKLGGQVFKAESVFGQPLPLPPRGTYGELGGAIGNVVGTIGTSWSGN